MSLFICCHPHLLTVDTIRVFVVFKVLLRVIGIIKSHYECMSLIYISSVSLEIVGLSVLAGSDTKSERFQTLFSLVVDSTCETERLSRL